MERVLALAAKESLARLLDAQPALDGECQHRSRETPIVVAHARQVAHRGRRVAPGWFVVRHDDAPGRIAPDRVPGVPVIENQQPEPGGREQRRPRVAEQVAGAARRARRGDVTLGPARDDGESFARPESARGAVGGDAGVEARGPFAAFRPLGAGVRLDADRLRGHFGGQHDFGADLVDRERPPVARDVPVELVVIGEVPELSIARVGDGVRVLAGGELHRGIADPDAYAIRALLDAVRLGPSITRHTQHVEARDHALTAVVRVHRREVAEYPTPDADALRAHAQRLADLERAVGTHTDVALPGENALVGARAGRYKQEGKGERYDRPQDPVHSCSRHQVTFAGSNSKYSAGPKPNSRAGIMSGNVAIRVFRLLTAPL